MVHFYARSNISDYTWLRARRHLHCHLKNKFLVLNFMVTPVSAVLEPFEILHSSAVASGQQVTTDRKPFEESTSLLAKLCHARLSHRCIIVVLDLCLELGEKGLLVDIATRALSSHCVL